MRKRTGKTICGKFRNRPNTHTTERMWKQENTGEKAELPLLGVFTITYFEDSPTMYQAVVGGQVAACFDDTPIMASNIKDTGIAMKIVEGTGNDPAAYGFAIFNADNQELVDMFNAGLANIKASGKYDEIIAKYLGE